MGICASTGPDDISEGHLWWYVDDDEQLQGPHTLEQMQDWFSEGYFTPAHLVRCDHSPIFLEIKVPCKSYCACAVFYYKRRGRRSNLLRPLLQEFYPDSQQAFARWPPEFLPDPQGQRNWFPKAIDSGELQVVDATTPPLSPDDASPPMQATGVSSMRLDKGTKKQSGLISPTGVSLSAKSVVRAVTPSAVQGLFGSAVGHKHERLVKAFQGRRSDVDMGPNPELAMKIILDKLRAAGTYSVDQITNWEYGEILFILIFVLS